MSKHFFLKGTDQAWERFFLEMEEELLMPDAPHVKERRRLREEREAARIAELGFDPANHKWAYIHVPLHLTKQLAYVDNVTMEAFGVGTDYQYTKQRWKKGTYIFDRWCRPMDL